MAGSLLVSQAEDSEPDVSSQQSMALSPHRETGRNQMLGEALSLLGKGQQGLLQDLSEA